MDGDADAAPIATSPEMPLPEPDATVAGEPLPDPSAPVTHSHLADMERRLKAWMGAEWELIRTGHSPVERTEKNP